MSTTEEQLLGQNKVTNNENTYQGHVTLDDNGNILEGYQDASNPDQYSNTPNTTTDATKSKTGSGLTAAEITNSLGDKESLGYSWNTKAEERAGLDYESQVIEAKSQYLTNRQELESQGQQMQEQVNMQKYSQNQSNEKAGWTGGYVLDTERQMAYLKQTIQSQMYGQMELQKYGYETSLAAARLAYDTNKYDLAMQYYQQAIENSLGEAQVTGYYVSPEVKEMLDQYSIASTKLNNGEGSEREEAILKSVTDWFEANGISKQGVETIVHQEFINNLKDTAKALANFQENSKISQIDLDSFGEVDENGDLIYSDDFDSVKIINFNNMELNKIIEYSTRCDTAKQQVIGYLEGLIEDELTKTSEALKTKTVYKEDLESTLNNSNIKKILDLYNTEGGSDLLNQFSYSSKVLGKDITISLDKSEEAIKFSYTHNFDKKIEQEEFDKKVKNATDNSSASGSLTFTEIINSKTELNNFKIKVQEGAIKDGKVDDDFDIDIGDKNYDVDVQWVYGSGWDRFWAWNNFGQDSKVGDQTGEAAWNKAIDYLKNTYGTPTDNQLVVYADKVWFYSKELKKWGYVQSNTGGDKLKADLKTAMNGGVPGRWD